MLCSSVLLLNWCHFQQAITPLHTFPLAYHIHLLVTSVCVCKLHEFTYLVNLPSVLWHCWLGNKKGIRPVKNWLVGAGMVVCLEQGADLHMAQLMPLPLTVSCFCKIEIGFTFLVPAHPGSPGQRAIKRAFACACVCVLAYFCQISSSLNSIKAKYCPWSRVSGAQVPPPLKRCSWFWWETWSLTWRM